MNNDNMKHPRDSSALSLSPPRQRYTNRGSATRYTVGDEPSCELAEDTKKVAEAASTNGNTREVRHRRASMPAMPAVVLPVKAPEEEPVAEPPRRRFVRRCSATMYNLHNYAQQVQDQQGELNR